MVGVTEAQTWTEIEGEIVDVVREEPNKEGMLPQWHIAFKSLDPNKVIKAKTGCLHVWIRETETCTETTVPRDSVIQKYVDALVDIHGDAIKNLATVKETFEFMKGKKYLLKSKVLGRAFNKNAPAEYWTPVKEL